MAKTSKDLRSPLSRARGLGAAKDGVHHFWVLRVSALALIPLSLWFVFSVACLASGPADFYAVQHWVSAPSVAVALVLFLATALYHSVLGVEEVILDYSTGPARLTLLLASKFLHAIVAAAGIFAVLKVALG
ncbi:succinate dehydrogenase, hydrophobic membrane anchor protein [Solimonas flava]|jgi:succinate dehydrogenase / fumarate reductase membrane anchor subunit|uniref:succinate dehydrogenase, hydrophobic membrane anchor protein n=1 Tax=Solimonas flava TaxID=415849 RepID=UPI000409E5B9|nr:succinate dehydrogenase, hydrophobic membrane anchor protein [Solimonas flava]